MKSTMDFFHWWNCVLAGAMFGAALHAKDVWLVAALGSWCVFLYFHPLWDRLAIKAGRWAASKILKR